MVAEGSLRVDVLGVPVDNVTMDQAVEVVDRLVRAGAGGLVVTPNPEMVMAARRDPELLAVLREADLAVPDGVGLVWASRLLGRPLAGRVAGYDLFLRLLELAARRDYRVYLLGGAPEVAAAAESRIRKTYGATTVVGFRHGYFTAGELPAVLDAIRAAGPHLVFVGMGSPRQERWMGRNRSALAKMVLMGVGGSFDVIAGRVARAPEGWQRANLEWLYRLVREPRRLRRQLVLPRFAAAVLLARLGRRRAGRKEAQGHR